MIAACFKLSNRLPAVDAPGLLPLVSEFFDLVHPKTLAGFRLRAEFPHSPRSNMAVFARDGLLVRPGVLASGNAVAGVPLGLVSAQGTRTLDPLIKKSAPRHAGSRC